MIKIKYEYELGEGSDARAIRQKVFMEEQGFKEEFDDIDKDATHVVVYKNTLPAGTGRTFPEEGNENCFVIGRIAVLKEYRRHHLGGEIVKALEGHAKSQGAEYTKLSAQMRVKGFYEKLGYVAEGEQYMDEHVPHVWMKKKL